MKKEIKIKNTNRIKLIRIDQIDVITNTTKEYSNLYEYQLKNKD